MDIPFGLTLHLSYAIVHPCVQVDQMALCLRSSVDRAFGCGPKGRRFESCRGRLKQNLPQRGNLFFINLVFVSKRVRRCPINYQVEELPDSRL